MKQEPNQNGFNCIFFNKYGVKLKFQLLIIILSMLVYVNKHFELWTILKCFLQVPSVFFLSYIYFYEIDLMTRKCSIIFLLVKFIFILEKIIKNIFNFISRSVVSNQYREIMLLLNNDNFLMLSRNTDMINKI